MDAYPTHRCSLSYTYCSHIYSFCLIYTVHKELLSVCVHNCVVQEEINTAQRLEITNFIDNSYSLFF